MKKLPLKSKPTAKDFNQLIDDIKRLCRITSRSSGVRISQGDNGTTLSLQSISAAVDELKEVVPVSQPLSQGVIQCKNIATVSAMNGTSAFDVYLFGSRQSTVLLSTLGNTWGKTTFSLFTGTSATLSSCDRFTVREKQFGIGDYDFVCVEPLFWDGEEY